MNKTRTAKVLSAAALANMAVGGFAAAPAAAHPVAGAATATKAGGFVPIPKPAAGVRPHTETGCGGNLCWGLHGGGNYVSYADEHFFSRTGCHLAHFVAFRSSNRQHSIASFNPSSYFCSKADAAWPVYHSYPTGTTFCGWMNTIPGGNTSLQGLWCEVVR